MRMTLYPVIRFYGINNHHPIRQFLHENYSIKAGIMPHFSCF
jgi:hypothetical protein